MPDRSEECRRAARWLWAAAGIAAAAALWANRRLFTVRAVETGATPEYPDLVPQVFAYPLDQVRAAAVETCASLPGCTLADTEGETLRATLGSGRTLSVRLEPMMDGKMTKATTAAASPGVRPDLGANARAVHTFQQRLRARLASAGEPDAAGEPRTGANEQG
ncbi:MAG: hypothetical protein GX774_21760 [Armatimonadetes bacterium]|jgi:hypothetical protein|nr:hypothetical protein [Armatimonadota bacterium]